MVSQHFILMLGTILFSAIESIFSHTCFTYFSLPPDQSNTNKVSMRTMSSTALGQKSKQSIKIIKLKRASIGSKQSSKNLYCLNPNEKLCILFLTNSDIQGCTKSERRWRLGFRNSKWKEEIRVTNQDRNFEPNQQRSFLVTKDTEKIKKTLSETIMKGSCKRESITDATFVTGAQIFVERRLNVESALPQSHDYMPGQASASRYSYISDTFQEMSFTKYHCVISANGVESKMIEKTPVHWNGSHKSNLTSIEVARDLMNAVSNFHSLKEANGGKELFLRHCDLSGENRVHPIAPDTIKETDIAAKLKLKAIDPILFAMIPRGISRHLFHDSAILCSDIEPGKSQNFRKRMDAFLLTTALQRVYY